MIIGGSENLKTENRGQKTDVGGRKTEATTIHDQSGQADSHGLHTDSHREGKG
ncbi:MAG: hypothetical protein GX452_13330 [Ignavibacteriales bacterium]|nr:hypothetical protein [Ignavibacteriales bacterium]